MPFPSDTRTAYCFPVPASLPPRPKSQSQSQIPGTSNANGNGSRCTSSSNSSRRSTVKNDRVYGMVRKPSNNINAHVFNQDKRKRGSRIGRIVKDKETAPLNAVNTPNVPSSCDSFNGGHSSTATIRKSKHHKGDTPLNFAYPPEIPLQHLQHQQQKRHNNNNQQQNQGCFFIQKENNFHKLSLNHQQQQQLRRRPKSSYQSYNDNNNHLNDDNNQNQGDGLDNAEKDRTRMIRKMLYGHDSPRDEEKEEEDEDNYYYEKHHSVIEPSFSFVFGEDFSPNPTIENRNNQSQSRNRSRSKDKYSKRFSSFLLGRRAGNGNEHDESYAAASSGGRSSETKSSGWLWKKSLSEGNLYTVKRMNEPEYSGYGISCGGVGRGGGDDDDDVEQYGREEISYREPYNNGKQNKQHKSKNCTGGNSKNKKTSEKKSEMCELPNSAFLVRREMNRHQHEHVQGRGKEEMTIVKMIGMDECSKNRMEGNSIGTEDIFEEGRKDTKSGLESSQLIGRTWERNGVDYNKYKLNNGYSNFDYNYNHDYSDDMNVMAMRQKPLSKFFRSISLRNLLPSGGMNKSRGAPTQGKPLRVSPPTVPALSLDGLKSFSSFRVKKSQQGSHLVTDQQPSPSSSTSSTESSQGVNNHIGTNCKETQRFSGSSLLGSAGSSYASSSSDNRSSIGTDDGLLKDGEEGVLYHPASQQIHLLKNSSSVDSFSTVPTTFLPASDMQQGFYGNGGTSTNSNGGGNSNGSAGGGVVAGNNNAHMTVHVDPHSVSANVSVHTHSQQQIQIQQHNNHQKLVGPSSHHMNGSNTSSNQVHQIHHHHPPHQHMQQQHVAFQHQNSSTALTMTNHYQTQVSLEDQGIDMTQSPGRESPSSTASSNTGSGSGSGSAIDGCRHSTASFDSGRASSTIYQQGVRYSGLSSESSSGSFRNSYHSSSSSLGSIAAPEEIYNFDVAAMIAQGIPDHEVLNAWLTGIHFECYYQNFIQAGYDMHGISKMTPEDLNAIGVTKPHHRKRLKSEISQLNIPDGLPDYIPGTIEEWLSLLKLEEYTMKLKAQGYHSVRQVTNITWEDLEDTGILKLGHQKKFMLAIKRIEDILAGKRIPTPNNAYLTPMSDSGIFQRQRSVPNTTNHSNVSMYNNHNGFQQNQQQFHPVYSRGPGLSQQQQQQVWRSQQQQQTQQQQQQNSSTTIYAHLPPHTLTHQPQLHHVSSSSSSGPATPVTPQYHPDVISIQVKNNARRKSMEKSQEPIYGTSSFLPTSSQNNPNNNPSSSMTLSNVRSNNSTVKFEEGDITPTNEFGGVTTAQHSTATLPRLLKNKPIAKIMGGGRMSNGSIKVTDRCPSPNEELQQEQFQQQQKQQQQQQAYGDGCKSLPRDIGRLSKAGINHYSGNYVGAGLKTFAPPPPPTRSTPLFSQQPQQQQPQQQPSTQQITTNYPMRRGSCSNMEVPNGYGVTNGGQPILSSFSSGGNTNSSHVMNRSSSTTMPPPPPNLSCDQFSTYSSSSRNPDDFPLPPHPDELSQNGGLNGSSSLHLNQQQQQVPVSASSSSTMNNNNNNASPSSALSTSNSSVQYYNNSNSGSSSNNIISTNLTTVNMTGKSRDPSPVGSDYSDSGNDLLPPGLLCRGVRRNGSDASFKSNSSTESESIPFANDNAGTIKQQKVRLHQQLVSTTSTAATAPTTTASSETSEANQGTGDVLNDIGNMLADLTDELDAILEQEMNSKR